MTYTLKGIPFKVYDSIFILLNQVCKDKKKTFSFDRMIILFTLYVYSRRKYYW